jgi:hypothetical protein
LLKYRQEAEARRGAVEAWIKRSEARRFTGEPITGFASLDERQAEALEDASFEPFTPPRRAA